MYEKILVTLDRTQFSESVLEHVEELASAGDSEVILLTVLPEPRAEVVDGRVVVTADQVLERSMVEAKEYLRGIAWRLGLHGIKTSQIVRFGEAAEEIKRCAELHEVDLIAMATHGRHGVVRFIRRSVAEKVARSVSTPMFLVKAA